MGKTRQSAQWGTYTPDQRYCKFLKSTKYVPVALTGDGSCILYNIETIQSYII